jgi:hypothetical protein
VLLVLGLLGGGLVCLLVVNTTLAANSIEITRLQQQNAAGTQHVQQLEQEVAQASSAAQIAKAARRLGMRPDANLTFIDLRSKKLVKQPGLSSTDLTGDLVPVQRPKKAGHHLRLSDHGGIAAGRLGTGGSGQ